MPPAPLVDPTTIDMSTIAVDKEGIRRANLQRFEMEQLDAIVTMDAENHLVIGYKDVREDEFWVRGHMPDFPLFPGVLMCETAAQLCSFYAQSMHLIDEGFLGFGGMEDVRFRGPVRPGDRLIMAIAGRHPREPPPDDFRDPGGLRRRQHGLPRPDHRRAALGKKFLNPVTVLPPSSRRRRRASGVMRDIR